MSSSNYCAKIWEAYRQLDTAHKSATVDFNSMIVKGDINWGQEILSGFEAQLNKLQEVWDGYFIMLELYDEETILFKEDYEAMEELDNLNDGRLHWKIGRGVHGIADIITVANGRVANLTTDNDDQITDITPLSKLTGIKTLSLGKDSITDYTPLGSLINLEEFRAEGRNSLPDCSPLWGLSNLRKISLSGNFLYGKLSDISTLRGFTQIKELVLSSNIITDITPLQNMAQLEILWLGENIIQSIEPLRNLTNLTTLNLYDNKIADISPLENLTKINYLHFADNNVVDLSPLLNLDTLQDLDIRENKRLRTPRQRAIIEQIRQNNPGIKIIEP